MCAENDYYKLQSRKLRYNVGDGTHVVIVISVLKQLKNTVESKNSDKSQL